MGNQAISSGTDNPADSTVRAWSPAVRPDWGNLVGATPSNRVMTKLGHSAHGSVMSCSSSLRSRMLRCIVAFHTEATLAGDVNVTVKYTGKGEVDASHRLWVWLFDTPEIGPGAIPIAEFSLTKNGDVAAFKAVSAAQVWIAVAYDEKGGFAGNAPPPMGSPVALYGVETGAPAPVTPGEKSAVTDHFQRLRAHAVGGTKTITRSAY